MAGADRHLVVVLIHHVENMLLDQCPRIEVVQVEVGELRTQLAAELAPCVGSHLPDGADHPAGLLRELRQLVGPEDEKGRDDQDHELGQADVEHQSNLPRVAGLVCRDAEFARLPPT